MAFPKKVALFTASWDNIGQTDETLKISWNYPNPPANPGNKQFLVGTECFLENDILHPLAVTEVPEDQLLASLSMSAILAGEILPGTVEFIDAITNQDVMYFQTIAGNVRLKASTSQAPNPNLVSDPTYGPDGTVFDLTFVKVGTSTPTKVVRADAWSICQYGNRIDSPAHAVPCIVGAIHKEFGFKKSQLGSANSANRNAVVDFVSTLKLWV